MQENKDRSENIRITMADIIEITERFSRTVREATSITTHIDKYEYATLDDLYDLAFMAGQGRVCIEKIGEYRKQLHNEQELQALDMTQESIDESVRVLDASIEKLVSVYNPAKLRGQNDTALSTPFNTKPIYSSEYTCRGGIGQIQSSAADSNVPEITRESILLKLLFKGTLGAIIVASAGTVGNYIAMAIVHMLGAIAGVSSTPIPGSIDSVILSLNGVANLFLRVFVMIIGASMMFSSIRSTLWIAFPIARTFIGNAWEIKDRSLPLLALAEQSEYRGKVSKTRLLLVDIVRKMANMGSMARSYGKVSEQFDWGVVTIGKITEYTSKQDITADELKWLTSIELTAEYINANLQYAEDADVKQQLIQKMYSI